MTVGFDGDVRAVLLDIEGTTTPIAFVHDTLFGYARRHLTAWLDRHAGSTDALTLTAQLSAEHRAEVAPDVPSWRSDDPLAERASVAAYARWLMAQDRKSPALKSLQGLIWEEGYRAGELRGVVYDDVPRAIDRWRERGLRVAIYSSGSVLAQRRLFESTAHGDLTPLISGFFDTAVGPKTDAASYSRIVETLGLQPGSVLFVSDVVKELEVARRAGLKTVLAVRPGNSAQPHADQFSQIASFDQILPPAPEP